MNSLETTNPITLDDLAAMVARGFLSIENRIDGIDIRLDNIETRLDSVETRLDSVEQRLDRIETRHERRIDILESRTVTFEKCS